MSISAIMGLASGGGGLVNSQEFTSSGTFNVPSGITMVSVLLVGGGGGGAGNPAGGAGGGGGGGRRNGFWKYIFRL